jgi:hypothetical protein
METVVKVRAAETVSVERTVSAKRRSSPMSAAHSAEGVADGRVSHGNSMPAARTPHTATLGRGQHEGCKDDERRKG